MNVVDSSGWLEYFSGSSRAKYFVKAIENTNSLVVPSISIYEVFKKVLSERNETVAIQAATQMQSGMVINLTLELALSAATISHEYRLPMADSIMLATARFAHAELWTQDADFKGITGVHYFPKK